MCKKHSHLPYRAGLCLLPTASSPSPYDHSELRPTLISPIETQPHLKLLGRTLTTGAQNEWRWTSAQFHTNSWSIYHGGCCHGTNSEGENPRAGQCLLQSMPSTKGASVIIPITTSTAQNMKQSHLLGRERQKRPREENGKYDIKAGPLGPQGGVAFSRRSFRFPWGEGNYYIQMAFLCARDCSRNVIRDN